MAKENPCHWLFAEGLIQPEGERETENIDINIVNVDKIRVVDQELTLAVSHQELHTNLSEYR